MIGVLWGSHILSWLINLINREPVSMCICIYIYIYIYICIHIYIYLYVHVIYKMLHSIYPKLLGFMAHQAGLTEMAFDLTLKLHNTIHRNWMFLGNTLR